MQLPIQGHDLDENVLELTDLIGCCQLHPSILSFSHVASTAPKHMAITMPLTWKQSSGPSNEPINNPADACRWKSSTSVKPAAAARSLETPLALSWLIALASLETSRSVGKLYRYLTSQNLSTCCFPLFLCTAIELF